MNHLPRISNLCRTEWKETCDGGIQGDSFIERERGCRSVGGVQRRSQDIREGGLKCNVTARKEHKIFLDRNLCPHIESRGTGYSMLIHLTRVRSLKVSEKLGRKEAALWSALL